MQKVIAGTVGYVIHILVSLVMRLLIVSIIYSLLHLYGKLMYTYTELVVLYLLLEFTLTGIKEKFYRMLDTVNKVVEKSMKTE